MNIKQSIINHFKKYAEPSLNIVFEGDFRVLKNEYCEVRIDSLIRELHHSYYRIQVSLDVFISTIINDDANKHEKVCNWIQAVLLKSICMENCVLEPSEVRVTCFGQINQTMQSTMEVLYKCYIESLE